MEYLLDINQLESAANVLAGEETPERLIVQIEELRALFHAKRFGNDLEEGHRDELRRKAYLLATLVSGPLSDASLEVRQRALGVSATIFEYLWGIDEKEERALDLGLNAVLFYSKGEYEAQASSLAKKIASSEAFLLQVEPPLVRECWKKLFLFLGRDFKKLLNLRSDRNAENIRDNIDDEDFWHALIEGCERQAIQLVWGEETDWLLRFDQAIESAREWGNTRLAWLGLTLRELASEMSDRSVRELFVRVGLPERAADAFTMDSIVELWKSHRVAFLGEEGDDLGILNNEVRSALINVPTSAGKSLIAEISITTFLNRNPGSRAIWIVPSRALVNEVFIRLKKRFKRIGFSVSTSVGGVELTPGETAFEHGARVLVVTPEKLDGLLRRVQDLLDVPTLVVFDEMHKIAEPGRGWFLESVIAWMLLKASTKETIKLLFMSAVLPNVDTFESWLGVGEERSESVTSSWRPTRLALFSVKETNYGQGVKISLHQQNSNTSMLGYRRSRTGSHQYRIPVEIVKYLVNEENTAKSILVFYYTKNDLNTFVGTLVAHGGLGEIESPEIQALSEKFSGIYGPEHNFTRAVKLGVGIDHGDLPIWLRGMVEESFRNQSLKILAANQVILEGVNFPIDDMLVCSLGSLGQDVFNYRLRKQDFINLIGRVGRALVNTEGRCFVFRPWIYTRSKEEQQEWQSYIDIDRAPDAHSTMKLEDDELLQVLQALTTAIEDGKDDVFDGIRSWREPLERLYSVVLGVAENPNGERYDQMKSLVKKTLAYQEVGPDSKRAIRRFVRAVNNSIEAADVDLYSLSALSGLSITSARVVRGLANEIIAAWNQVDQDIELTFESIFNNESFNQLTRLRECYQPITYGTRSYRTRIDQYRAISSWLNMESWEQVSEVILTEHGNLVSNTKAQIVASYVSQMFEYRLPWALSGVALAAKELGAPEDLQNFLDSLPSFVRFGVATTAGVEISKIVRGERSVALTLIEHFEESGTELDELKDWVFEITLGHLRDWFPNETEHNLERLRDELHGQSLRNWALRRRGRIRTELIDVNQDAWDELNQRCNKGEDPIVTLQVDQRMEEVPHSLSISANFDDEKILIGFLKKQHEEEILELLEWGRIILVQMASHRGKLIDPPTVKLTLTSAMNTEV